MNYDLIVVGAGSGGLVAAEVAAALGAKVALVEANQTLGGECLHTGCVPSKALIHGARNFKLVREQITDWQSQSEAAYQKARASIKSSIKHIQDEHDNDAFYENKGIKVHHSPAKFTGRKSIELADGTKLQAKRFIIATGSKPFVPPIPGLKDVKFLTNETVFGVESLPKSLIVIGGGPIGCELGQAFAMFGTKLTILSQDTKLLPRDEPEAGAALQANLATYENVKVIYEAKITRVSQDEQITVNYSVGEEQRQVSAAHILVATGRAPNIDLNLEAAGVKYTDRSITVNNKAQTSNKHVYAVGDVAGGPNFTHVAADHAVVAVQNALLGIGRKKRSMDELIWATFTSPEIAHLGADEASLKSKNIAYKVELLNFSDIDKAVADEEPGIMKIMTTPKGHILGATIIGGPASELISILAVAKHQKMTFTKLGDVLQAYPTYAFGLRAGAGNASLLASQKGITSLVIRILRKLNLG